tara:strand:+ start:5147 stop:5755 length:609 start_codon:yes stop_codon:yes gene_type:complete
MAVSEVQIAKLALQHLGDRYDITSLSESSAEAEQVNLVFGNLRDKLLRSHPWKFATAYAKPSALVGTPPAQWSYMFTYPSNALKVWRIVNPMDPRGDTLEPLPFTVARNTNDVKVLLSDEGEPEFEYAAAITDTARFDTSFDIALSWSIAEHIALPITGDLGIRNAMRAEAAAQANAAKTEDANEGYTRKVTRDPDWIIARS